MNTCAGILFGMGSEEDFHSAHWHGLRALEEGHRRTDTIELLPATMKVADTLADNPGAWLLHCHVAEHMSKGMFARFTVRAHNGGDEVSREPEAAFFGMPQALATLRVRKAQLSTRPEDPAAAEVDLEGQVTVPDPFLTAQNAFVVKVGDKTATMHPDASGLSVSPDAILLVKNTSQQGNGALRGGTLEFELTLRGPGWAEELRKLKAIDGNNAPAAGVSFPISLEVGPAKHAASATLEAAK